MKSVSRSVFWEGRFGPCSLYFIWKDLIKLFQSVFFIFVMGFFFEEIFHFAKTTEFSRKGGWRTAIPQEAGILLGGVWRPHVRRRTNDTIFFGWCLRIFFWFSSDFVTISVGEPHQLNSVERLNSVSPSHRYFGMIGWGSLVGQDSLL